nr:MAG TPA: hypothetical protein [Caudoviricetes sp.]
MGCCCCCWVYIYKARDVRVRARVYTTRGMVVKSCREKGHKKTLEHSPTFPTAHSSCGNRMISDTP